ncbi:hypothetical protein [Photorhabdus heterorhabditis]|nr:hypothetical protein [Photorhabdus heterorhabditis]
MADEKVRDADEVGLLADLYADDNAGTDTPPDSSEPTSTPDTR